MAKNSLGILRKVVAKFERFLRNIYGFYSIAKRDQAVLARHRRITGILFHYHLTAFSFLLFFSLIFTVGLIQDRSWESPTSSFLILALAEKHSFSIRNIRIRQGLLSIVHTSSLMRFLGDILGDSFETPARISSHAIKKRKIHFGKKKEREREREKGNRDLKLHFSGLFF